jgi:hypothetical protein
VTKIKFQAHATSEFKKIAAYYAQQKPGLGLDFADELDRTLSYVRSDPEPFPKVLNEIRHVTMRRFPYCVFYVIREQYVQVIAIGHFRQRPGYWMRRRRK